VLAYVFWHAPEIVDDLDTYETALAAFHRGLTPADIRGFRGSHACAVDGAVWVAAPVVYEDWYFVDDFTALGTLNENAVSGHRRTPHDNVAAMAVKSIAGAYALHHGAAQVSNASRAVWFGKPRRTSYDEFYDQVGDRGSLWRRQMVLGPTPEFCSIDDDDTPAGAVVVTRIRTVASSTA
jgi:hypothetical protein